MPSGIDYSQEEPVFVPPTQVKTIAVIGGGASGAVVIDSLLKEQGGITKITAFERRQRLGGVWALDENPISTPNDIIKPGYSSFQTDPQLPNPFHDPANSRETRLVLPRSNQERFLHTPSYQGIQTNIIENMMTFSDNKRWPVPGNLSKEETSYVDGGIVQKYIDEYINRHTDDERLDLVREATVEDVERIPRETSDPNELPYRFRVTIRKYQDKETDLWYQQDFDAIVVAVGHYHVPFIPEVEGLREVQDKFPGVVEHAKFYRLPDAYTNKKVVVIGSRASGADLSKQISTVAHSVYQSIRTQGIRPNSAENIFGKPVISKYVLLEDGGFKVVFEDGTEVENPDHVIYGTGYDFSYPFLNRLTDSKITLDGKIVPELYQHTFLINEPLISFVGVPIDGISFRVFEFQAVLASRFLSGKIKLPPRKDQYRWTVERFEAKGKTRAYHTIGIVDALDYIRTLTALGQIDSKQETGRPFPPITEEDVEAHRAAGERLKKFWDDSN